MGHRTSFSNRWPWSNGSTHCLESAEALWLRKRASKRKSVWRFARNPMSQKGHKRREEVAEWFLKALFLFCLLYHRSDCDRLTNSLRMHTRCIATMVFQCNSSISIHFFQCSVSQSTFRLNEMSMYNIQLHRLIFRATQQIRIIIAGHGLLPHSMECGNSSTTVGPGETFKSAGRRLIECQPPSLSEQMQDIDDHENHHVPTSSWK